MIMTATLQDNENDMPRSPPLLCRHPHPRSQTSKTPTTHNNHDAEQHNQDENDQGHDEQGKVNKDTQNTRIFGILLY